MKEGRMRQGVFVAAAVLLACSSVCGEVFRVQTGRVLDANYQVGSGGENRPRPPSPRPASQLYVTGQVTGLGRFRGRIGYSSPQELRLSLPSASLAVFRQESVGLPQAAAGEPYRASVYYDRTRTVFGAGHIAASGAATGSEAAPEAAFPPGLLQRLYRNATADYGPLGTLGVGRALSPTAGQTALDFAPSGAERGNGGQAPAAPRGAAAIRQEPLDLRLEEASDQAVQPSASEGEPAEAPAADGGEAQAPPDAAAGALVPGRDVYVDLLVRLGRTPARSSSKAAPHRRARAKAPGVEARQIAGRPRHEDIVIQSLAGASGDRLNAGLAVGDRKLGEGRFYEAAAAYEAASATRPENPLPRVGLALALFGAGEPYGAAKHLYRSMALFPPMMEVRLDVGRMMPREAFAARLEALDESRADLPREAQRMLVFLATYMHRLAGRADQARAHARSLAVLADNDLLLQTYATHVLAGK
jgi:hypothetical protein